MKNVKKTREALDINQEHLAIYLGVGRSVLSMVEIGQRELPTAALLKLTELHENFVNENSGQTVSMVIPEIIQQQDLLQIFLQEQEIAYLQKALQLQKQLKEMQTNYKNGLKLLQAVRLQLQQLQNAPKSKKDKLWLAATEAMAIEKIKLNSLVAQKKIELQIENLQYLAAGITDSAQ